MKTKVTVCFLGALLSSVLTVAQGTNFGLTAGWHTAGIIAPPVPDALTLFSAYGFNNVHGGAWGEIRLHKSMHLRLEAHFSTANMSGSVVVREADGTPSFRETRIRERSLRVPVLFNYYANHRAAAFLGATLVVPISSEIDRELSDTSLPFRENRSDFDVALTTGMLVVVHPRVSATAWVARHINHFYNERPDAFFSPRFVSLGVSMCYRLTPGGKSVE